MSSRPAPTRLRSALVGGGIAVVGILIGLGSLNVIARAGGDLSALLPMRRGALIPAWVMASALIVIGTVIAAAGTWIAWIGWRAAQVAENESANLED